MERQGSFKKEIGAENFVFLGAFVSFFALFVSEMGLINTLSTLMKTAHALLLDTVIPLTAICVLMGAFSSLFSEFGVMALANRLLNPLMKPLYGLPGVASVGVVATFLSDNPAILPLAEDTYIKSLFKKYQLPALTNLGTSFGMGLIVCTYMLSLNASYARSVGVGLLGALVGSVVSTRLMLGLTQKFYGSAAHEKAVPAALPKTRPIREGTFGTRFMEAALNGGHDGIKMGAAIIPGVLLICPLVMMLTNGPHTNGTYTGAAYEGIRLLPWLADKLDFVLRPLFGFSSPEALGVPITALGSAGAATSLTARLAANGLVNAGDIAVLTAMCMCWSGYLSTHVAMMKCLRCPELIGKALLSHTLGGLSAGVAAHWLFRLFA